MSKSELALKYGISVPTLRKMLNENFFHELEPLGYSKSDKLLSPNVVRKFIELYGEPINDEL